MSPRNYLRRNQTRDAHRKHESKRITETIKFDLDSPEEAKLYKNWLNLIKEHGDRKSALQYLISNVDDQIIHIGDL